MRKLSQRHLLLKKISKRDAPDSKALIKELRQKAKQDPKIKEKFKQYGVPLSDIDKVKIEFADLDVSAKTKDKKIYLNKKLLNPKGKNKDPLGYLVHELIHYLQQSTGNIDLNKKTKEYLDRPTEQEAFKVQVEHKKREQGAGKAEEYVEGLLDHHEIGGKKREKYKNLLKPE